MEPATCKSSFLISVIGKKTQSSETAASISIDVSKKFSGFSGLTYAFPMLWIMHGDKDSCKDGWFVYLMQSLDGEKIKIGCSQNVEKRRRQNERSMKVELETILELPGDFRTENLMHELFSTHKSKNEWYENNESMLYWVDLLIKTAKESPSLSTPEIIDDVKWKMLFFGAEERGIKKIIDKFIDDQPDNSVKDDLVSFGTGLRIE